MTGKPFSKELTLGADVPSKIVGYCDDIDLQGNSLNVVAADVMREAMGYGICGIHVDHPVVNKDEVKTLADERKIGARPYAVFVKHNQILGCKIARQNGVTMLTQLRISETKEVPDGEFGTKLVNRVRVLEPGTWAIWEEQQTKDGKSEYVRVEEGTTTLNVVPFVPFYGTKLGFMCGISPLLDLAYQNVKHWQSQSDQDNILHVARVPILVAIGVEDGIDANGKPVPWSMSIGASAAVRIPSKDGNLKYVEHNGAAIEAGEKSLEKLEDQMVQTGAELLVVKPGEQKSATQSSNDADANKCDLQRIVESHEDSWDQVLQLMALWSNENDGGHVTLFKDFAAANLNDASAQLILSMQSQGMITKKTAINEQKRRGTLSPDLDADAELEAVSLEGPSLGTMGVA
jgi:hypothetical protein